MLQHLVSSEKAALYVYCSSIIDYITTIIISHFACGVILSHTESFLDTPKITEIIKWFSMNCIVQIS